MRTKVNVPRSGIALSTLLQGLIFAAGAQCAFAAPAAQSAETGLLKLANVKIQSATPEQIKAAAAQKNNATATSGVRAYKDKDSGKLRDQTPEEMIEEGAPAVASTSETAVIITPSKGGVAAQLDESFMSSAVATKDAAGNLHMDCVIGKDATSKALVNGKAIKGHRHDH